jgi:2-phosphoglycerate kinase
MSDLRPPDVGVGVRDERLRALDGLELPLILLVGGGTGTGKSTVTTEVAYRLGITRVTSTDIVRQTMRAFFSREFMPSIHYSSFEASQALRHPDESVDPVLTGFMEQTRNVLVGVKAVVQRALTEKHSLALEGIHVVPGLLPRAYERAIVVQCLLAIGDEEAHTAHFWVRDSASDGLRPVQKYVEALPDIRRIQSYLVERAARAEIPVIDNSSVDETIDAVIDLIVAAVERAKATA